MKKRSIVRFCVIALAIGLVFAGCDLFEAAGKENADSLILTGTSNGKALTIIISQGSSSRAVLTPKSGDYYEIRLDGVLVSKGKIAVNGSSWTFTPAQDSPNKYTATAVFSGGTLSGLTVPDTTISNGQASTAGSPSGNNGNDEKPLLTGTVTIDKTSPKVSETLTAAYSGNGTGTAAWQWLRNSTLLENTNSNTYIVTPADEGATLRARVSYANQEGSITSAATAAVTDTRPVLTGTVTISNALPNVGDTLTATYTAGNGTGTTVWQWLREDELISGAAGNNYTVVAADAGKTLKARVSCTGQKGNVASAATAAVTNKPALTGTVTIAKIIFKNTSPNVGDYLEATYSGGNGTGTATWQWLRGDTPISGANNRYYEVDVADAGKTLKARVSYSGQGGSVVSAATAAVTNKPALTGTVTINNALPRVGDTLTATYSPGNGSGTATWQWVRYGNDYEFIGANSSTYTVVAADLGKSLTVAVSYANQGGYILLEDETGAVADINGFVAVQGIILLQPPGVLVGEPFPLNGEAVPENATKNTIVWEVVNAETTATGAYISDNVLTVTSAGNVVVKGTIANGKADGTDYTEDFTIWFYEDD